MKIVFLLELNKYQFGGGDYLIFKFAEYLAKFENSVTIFYASHADFYEKQFEISQLKILHKINIPPLFRGCSRANEYLEKIYDNFILEIFIKNNEKDIDYIIGYQTKTAIKATKLGEKYGIKTANFIFETPEWLKRQWGKKWIETWKKTRLQNIWYNFKESLKRSDIVFPISEITKKETEKWLGRTINEVIYPGVDIPSNSFLPNSKSKDQIIYVGRLSENKNINEIIRALSKIKNPPKFIICGTGPEKQNLIELSKKLNVNSDFKGTVSDKEKWKLISESKFMVFPTSFEGFGMPPMEALACGIPCICLDIPILREAYEDKIEYFEEHNMDFLVKKIQYLMNNPDYCKKIGEEGRKYVKSKFSLKKSTRKIEKILEKER